MAEPRTEAIDPLNVVLRPGRPEEAPELGRICFNAFSAIAGKHDFPPDFPSPEVVGGLMSMLLSRPDIYSVVAEDGTGRVLGSNFLWESDAVSGVGPVTVDPDVQNSSVGRRLMENVIRRSDDRGFQSVRLLQAAYHSRSLALYTKLGFNTVELLSNIQGRPLGIHIDGHAVRPMTEADVAAADEVCRSVHGHSRRNEIFGSISQGSAMVVEHQGRITGYSTGVSFFGHSACEANEDLKALIGAAKEFGGPGFLLPTRNGEMLRWCLEHGLRIVQPLTLMSRGIYQEPRGAFMPSILF
ncbi:MAG TPA: GNAT family N-acetyltransferase [Pyrinomonadaceae bacterium]|nr:GNAT family N-acetyltransferase [Pyrinomonadaceae bacterium]